MSAAVTAPRIAPPVTDASRPFWTGGADGRLLIQRCDLCRRWQHPPLDECVKCGGPVVARPVSGAGTVFTFTIDRHPYHPDVPPPYVVAVVELVEQDGLRFTTNIVGCDPEDVTIGMLVQVTFEPAGPGTWAPVFRPA